MAQVSQLIRLMASPMITNTRMTMSKVRIVESMPDLYPMIIA